MSGAPGSDPRVITRPPVATDREGFLAAVAASRSLHEPWIHPPTGPAEFDLYLERYQAADHVSRVVCQPDGDSLIGVINLNNIIRGYFQNAFLGFYSFLPHAGRGLMQSGLRQVITEAFDELGLHRLEANIQPTNKRSINFVRRAGFTREGYSRRYLRIAGEWRDHERWALLSDAPTRTQEDPGSDPGSESAD